MIVGLFDANPADPLDHEDVRAEPATVPVSELADLVVHRVFGVGLIIQSAASLADSDSPADPIAKEARARLELAVEELDGLIRDVRALALRSITADGATASGGAGMSCSEVCVAASQHAARAASLLADQPPAPEDGVAWWAVETARRDLHGVAIALGDSGLGCDRRDR